MYIFFQFDDTMFKFNTYRVRKNKYIQHFSALVVRLGKRFELRYLGYLAILLFQLG